MKSITKVLAVICSVLVLVSCNVQPQTKLIGTDIKDLDFGSRYENAMITKLNVWIGNQGFANLEGELFNDRQLYKFELVGKEIDFEEIEGYYSEDTVYISLDELKAILSDLDQFLMNEYGKDGFGARFFLASHFIHTKDDSLPIYLYNNGRFDEYIKISEITAPCILVNAGDVAFFLLIK